MSLTDTIQKIGALPMILRRLTEIGAQLKRLGDLYELDLAYRDLHLKPPEADTSGDDPEAFYTDEERDLARDIAEVQGRKVE